MLPLKYKFLAEIPTRLKAIIERFQDNGIFKYKNCEVVDKIKPASRD